jgi:phosphomannomutase
MRLSGTEPVVRCYCESHSETDTAALVEAARKFVSG